MTTSWGSDKDRKHNSKIIREDNQRRAAAKEARKAARKSRKDVKKKK